MKEIFSCRVLHISKVGFPFFLFLFCFPDVCKSKPLSKMHSLSFEFNIIDPRLSWKLSSDRSCFLFMETFPFLKVSARLSGNFTVVWQLLLCVLSLEASTRFSSKGCLIQHVSTFIERSFSTLFSGCSRCIGSPVLHLLSTVTCRHCLARCVLQGWEMGSKCCWKGADSGGEPCQMELSHGSVILRI